MTVSVNTSWLLLRVPETSGIDGRSCVLTLARCLDNALCYASLRRVKIDCVWNDTVDWKTGIGVEE